MRIKIFLLHHIIIIFGHLEVLLINLLVKMILQEILFVQTDHKRVYEAELIVLPLESRVVYVISH